MEPLPAARSGQRKRALLVGAYERDNFGDELFLLVTEHYLAEAGYDAVAAAPFAADMTPLLDRVIDRFADRLNDETFDLVWTVGGEAGAIGTDGAMRWSVAPDVFARYQAGDAAARARLRRQIMGDTPTATPYMPRLSAFPRNVLTPTVINSIGIASIAKANTDRRADVFRVLREATAISVRESQGSAALSAAGIAHTVAPDLVHAIRSMRPRPVDDQSSGYVLVQVNQAQTRALGLDRFADAIADSPALKPYPLRLFFAGLAAGHDSPEEYRRIRDRILLRDPGRDVEILDGSRRPWDLVDEIRRAALWFGASLHGRIVASAYDVPRISLARGKVDTYAQAWDDAMPWKVGLDGLDAAVRSALSEQTRADAAGTGERLAALAEANVRNSIALAAGATPLEIALRRARAQERDLGIVRRERDAARRDRDVARMQQTRAKRAAEVIAEKANRSAWKTLISNVVSTRAGRRAVNAVRKCR